MGIHLVQAFGLNVPSCPLKPGAHIERGVCGLPLGYLLVLHYDEYAQSDIENELRRSVRFHRMRSKTVTHSGAEMTVEIRLDHRVNIVSAMLDINGVHDATLVACQTEAGA